jgi:hypothetical protein
MTTKTPSINPNAPTIAWTVVTPYDPSSNLPGRPGKMYFANEAIITLRTTIALRVAALV